MYNSVCVRGERSVRNRAVGRRPEGSGLSPNSSGRSLGCGSCPVAAGLSDPRAGERVSNKPDRRRAAPWPKVWEVGNTPARVLRLSAACRFWQAPMDEKHPDGVTEFTIGRTPAGDVLLSLVHAASPRAYLKGKAEQAHLRLSPEQARNLADELREVASQLGAEDRASERAQDQPPTPPIVNLNPPSGPTNLRSQDQRYRGRWKVPRVTPAR